MGGNLLPNLPPGETDNTFKLLSLIADPEAAKNRLAELVAQEKSASEREQAAVETERKAAALYAAASDRQAKLDAREGSINEDYDRKIKVLSEREANLNDREIYLTNKERDLASRESALARGLDDIKTREANAAIQEQVNQDNSLVLQRQQDQWRTKLEAVQSVINKHFKEI